VVVAGLDSDLPVRTLLRFSLKSESTVTYYFCYFYESFVKDIPVLPKLIMFVDVGVF
jgi:hypothetical protein